MGCGVSAVPPPPSPLPPTPSRKGRGRWLGAEDAARIGWRLDCLVPGGVGGFVMGCGVSALPPPPSPLPQGEGEMVG